jgi:transcriptional regulator
MYTPAAFRETDIARLGALMRDYPFALLLTVHDDAIEATHLPFMLEREHGANGMLVAHMARANPHWRCFDGHRESLVIFTGPHAYVSPSWYEQSTEVPTWNYAAVHLHGCPRIVTNKERVRAMLDALVARHERDLQPSWSTTQIEDYVREQMDYIVAFEMPIERIEGKFKLSQNRGIADRAGVIAALAASERELDRKTATLMSSDSISSPPQS